MNARACVCHSKCRWPSAPGRLDFFFFSHLLLFIFFSSLIFAIIYKINYYLLPDIRQSQIYIVFFFHVWDNPTVCRFTFSRLASFGARAHLHFCFVLFYFTTLVLNLDAWIVLRKITRNFIYTIRKNIIKSSK